jgi:hypothetical protein
LVSSLKPVWIRIGLHSIIEVAPEENARSTAPWGMKGSHRVIRSLYFTSEPDGTLGLASAMEHAVLEVIAVPDDYTDAMAQQIAESVHKAGILETRARAGARGGPIRITWAALVEKGMAAGVLEQEDA